MRILVVIATLSAVRANPTLHWEVDYHNFVVKNNEVNDLANDVTRYIGEVNDQVMVLVENFQKNISDLRQNYGWEKASNYSLNLRASRDVYKSYSNTSSACLGHIQTLLDINQHNQNDIKNTITAIMNSFTMKYVDLYRVFMQVRQRLTTLERAAFNCGDILESSTAEAIDCWYCMRRALGLMQKAHEEANFSINHANAALTEAASSGLANLYNALQSRAVLKFYKDERKMGENIREYCLEHVNASGEKSRT